MDNKHNHSSRTNSDPGLGNGPGMESIPSPEHPESPTGKLEEIVDALMNDDSAANKDEESGEQS